ncbi:hypothetical protein PB01_20940 (plasmid) [Psychrobacillus glaciei]|uniref:Restriction endonuclease n=1 Tax=Psychrobacillus glaciei TaxID=2283160 RepID=A0A5J6STG4_9BACI|nr:BglII/BstYI family type II restriction endonuclease [Psychrobacillus glaciei]QFG01297.1 hypothetical protein PB01_20940 [Psychrobacillus glaciei]
MEYRMYSHRYAAAILNTDREFADIWLEVQEVIHSITEEQIINSFEAKGYRRGKSISTTINELLKVGFIARGWRSESPIFQNPDYTGDTWRLDFAKDNISIEVAFNHGTVIAWNLLKPVLASELNHVQKAIQTKLGIIICVTEEMKVAGGFDGAIGTYEKFIEYLPPLNNQLSVPLLIIGLEAPQSFSITHVPNPQKANSKMGIVERILI